MRKKLTIFRILEIIPGVLSWGTLLSLIALSAVRPVIAAIIIVIFDFYWIVRTIYLTSLLMMAHRKLAVLRERVWINDCKALEPTQDWKKHYHLIIFPIYKEGVDIVRASLKALEHTNYPKEKMIVVLAFEDRYAKSHENEGVLAQEFSNKFFAYLSTFHPDGLEGETKTKGANATWAAKKAKEFIIAKGINIDDVIVSCFDADTCVEREYFGCLTYHFLMAPYPHQVSYQPIPVYNNNIWYAPSFARLVEMTSSFCQMIDSMRLEKFVTFSSHSMSFKTLVAIDYWPVDMISDDSVIYWKAYLYYNGHYTVKPLYITVSMDAAFSTNIAKTIVVQYRQKRRWAWGVENFPFVVKGFLENERIPLLKKIRRTFHLLESHVTWAMWAFIVMVITPLPILIGGTFFNYMAVGYNLPRITGILFHFTLISSVIWILLSFATLPPRPADIKRTKRILFLLEWLMVPLIILILGSTPALDAQTRMLLGRYMGFDYTEKGKPSKKK